MNTDNAIALIDKVCSMALLNREDHIRVAQAIEFIKRSLAPQIPPNNDN
jgi:hypothetical protein